MIAVPVDSRHASNAVVSERFGDADFFLLFGERGQLVQTIANHRCGSGEAIAGFLARCEVTQVLFRHLGTKLYQWLQAEGIDAFPVVLEGMPVVDGVDALLAGTLERLTDRNQNQWLHAAGQGKDGDCLHPD